MLIFKNETKISVRGKILFFEYRDKPHNTTPKLIIFLYQNPEISKKKKKMTSVDYNCDKCNHHWTGEIINVIEAKKMKRICRNCKNHVTPSFESIAVKFVPNEKLEDVTIHQIEKYFDPSKIERVDDHFILYFFDKQLYEENLKKECTFGKIEQIEQRSDVESENKEDQRISPTPQKYVNNVKIYRFVCFNGSSSNGAAVACAESKKEAISRILLSFNKNMTMLMSRNYKIDKICSEVEHLIKNDSEEDFFAAVYKKYGWSRERYYSEIGPKPKDYFNGWGVEHRSKNIEVINQIIKKELEQCECIEYELNDCAFYQGGN